MAAVEFPPLYVVLSMLSAWLESLGIGQDILFLVVLASMVLGVRYPTV